MLVDYQNLRNGDDPDGLATFSEWLNQQVCLRIEAEEIGQRRRNTGNSNKPGNGNKGRSSSFGTTTEKTEGGEAKQNNRNPTAKTGSTSKKALASKANNNSTSTQEWRTNNKCPLCKNEHFVSQCRTWLNAKVSERWKIAKNNHLCFRCLRSSHVGKDCPVDRKCGIQGCSQNHHRHLHFNPESKETSSNAFGVSEGGKVKTVQVGLRLIPVYVRDANGSKRQLTVFLDDGSDSSYGARDVVTSLGCHIEEKNLKLSTLAEEVEIPSGLSVLTIESVDGNIQKKIGVRVIESLCKNVRSPNWNKLKEKWTHLKDIPFPKIENSKVDLLIGADHPELLLSLEEVLGSPGQPVARRTPLGWTCIGMLEMEDCRERVQSYSTQIGPTTSSSFLKSLDEDFKRLWDMDVLEPDPVDVLSPDEKTAMEKTSTSLKFLGDRFEVQIPWKEDTPTLPDNRVAAERRMRSLESTLRKKPEVAEKYGEAFQSLVKKGYIRKLTPEEARTPGWYLPHFAVLKEDKETTKVRIVYDAAATYEGTSLNDKMYAGPNLQKDIVDVLLNFRRYPVALVGDIKEMFNQIVMNPEDRKYHRLLWRDFKLDVPPETFETERLVFGDKASPFLAMFVLQEQARKMSSRFPVASKVILNQTYMDDIICGFETEDGTTKVRIDLQKLAKPGGFEIRRWCSNSLKVLEGIPEEDRVQGIEIREEILPSVKTLGIWWDAQEDVFKFVHKDTGTDISTKRQLLSRIATTYDPFQILGPLMIRGKVLLQETWLLGLGWDDPVPAELREKIEMWQEQMKLVGELKYPRCMRSRPSSGIEEISLHTFTDASKDAYAAVSFIRYLYKDDAVEVAFVASKSRVTPLRAVSVPRLELMAAVLGLRLARVVSRALEISMKEHTFWTDSTDVIYWVRGRSKKYKPFIANRVAELHEFSSPQQWRHTPGKLNPADDATRGLDVNQMSQQSRWYAGPEFLHQKPENWPETKAGTSSTEKIMVENVAKNNLAISKMEEAKERIQFDRFHSWLRLLRSFVWIVRFISYLKRKVQEKNGRLSKEEIESQQTEQPTFGRITASELETTEKKVVKIVQAETFSDALRVLKTGRNCRRSDLRGLSPFLDGDGILRVGGRLQQADLPFDTRHPIILPRRHHLTELVIRKSHTAVGHSRGVNAVLTEIRQRYWIVNGREAVKQATYRCYFCRRLKGTTATQIMAPLPSDRVNLTLRAFCHCGIDFAGPFVVKITRRISDKRYMCLFTCLQSRAVHLEITFSMDTDGFLLAFSRMVARRGKPQKVVSDNGTNLTGGEKKLKELVESLDQSKILDTAANQAIDWKFNPPYGSHHGGIFESLIKSAKKALYQILGDTKLTDEELLTAMVEVEGLLNSRPLMYCSSDPADEPVLTPNHFLHGQCGGPLAPQIVDETSFNPRQRWRLIQDLISK